MTAPRKTTLGAWLRRAAALPTGMGAAVIASVAVFGLTACATQSETALTPAARAASDTGNSAPIRALALPAQGGVTNLEGWLREADINRVFSAVRADADVESDDPLLSLMLPVGLAFDDLVAQRPAAARARFAQNGPAAQLFSDLVEAWVLFGEGDKAAAVAHASKAQSLSTQLANVQVALLHEAAGDFNAARSVYSRIEQRLDLTPPTLGEPRTAEEFVRRLQAGQTAQLLYRAALAAHRNNDATEARRLYALVETFAPRSPDVAANLTRLEAGQAPKEPALDATRAMGRWALFLSEEFSRVEGLQKAINNPGVDGELASPAGLMLALAGAAYDPSADDWRLEMARQLYSANAYTGADRVASLVNPRSVFAPEAALLRAYVALRDNDKAAATRLAQSAMRAAANRFDIVVGAAQVLDEAEQDAPAIAAFNAALLLAPEPKDRAAALLSRGFTHRHFGRIDAAIADARAALDADRRNEGVRIAAIAIFMDNPNTWTEAVSLGRELLRENPDSVTRLNQLGYSLIQRDEGLDEGILLLHRGANLEPTDFAVIDSLGWAYYLFGDFEEARRLIERANELTGDDPNSEILDHLGDVYWRLDRQDDARATWRKALEARPELQRRRAIEAKLRDGLTTPAPVKRPLPPLEEVKPRERQDI